MLRACQGRAEVKPVLLLIAVGAMSACSKSEPDVSARNASVAEVAEQVRGATSEPGFIKPGKWLSSVTMEDVSAPGMPPQVREQMQGMLAQRQAYESCLTPEDAKRPKEDFFVSKDSSCRYEHFTMGDGKIDARMNCSHEGMKQVMTLNGSYSPDTYKMTMDTKMEGGPESMAGMSMRMRVDAKRVGECEARKS
jgi:hypothetical protein